MSSRRWSESEPCAQSTFAQLEPCQQAPRPVRSPAPAGPATYADIAESERDLGFRPTTPIDAGLPRFVAWYRGYHRV